MQEPADCSPALREGCGGENLEKEKDPPLPVWDGRKVLETNWGRMGAAARERESERGRSRYSVLARFQSDILASGFWVNVPGVVHQANATTSATSSEAPAIIPFHTHTLATP